MGQEGIPQGLKPALVAAVNVRAKARAYLRSSSNNPGDSSDTTSGLKPAFVAAVNAGAKARAYRRSNSNNPGDSSDTT